MKYQNISHAGVLAVTLATLVLSGCANNNKSVPNQPVQNAQPQYKKTLTTQIPQTVHKLEAIELDQSPETVRELMGKPDKIRKVVSVGGYTEAWTYSGPKCFEAETRPNVSSVFNGECEVSFNYADDPKFGGGPKRVVTYDKKTSRVQVYQVQCVANC